MTADLLRGARIGLLAGLLASLPPLLWLLPQSGSDPRELTADRFDPTPLHSPMATAARPALDALWLALATCIVAGAPLLAATSGMLPAAAALLMAVLVPLPLWVLAWLIGAASVGALGRDGLGLAAVGVVAVLLGGLLRPLRRRLPEAAPALGLGLAAGLWALRGWEALWG
jgi:hypothetical protein